MEGAAEPVRQSGSEAKAQQIVPFHSLKDYDVRDERVLVMPSAEQSGAFSVHIHHRAFPLRGMSCQQSSLEREWCLNAMSHILKGRFTDNSFMVKAKIWERLPRQWSIHQTYHCPASLQFLVKAQI